MKTQKPLPNPPIEYAGGVLSIIAVETVGSRPVTSTNPYV